MHTVLITLHALAGVLALGAGATAFARPGRWLRTYLVALVAMLVLLAGAMVAAWASYDAGTRVAFALLAVLGVGVVAQGVRAFRLRPRPGRSAGEGHREALGFTLVALTDAFLVVAVLDLGGPVWSLFATGALVAVGGHLLLVRVPAPLSRARTALR